MYVTFVIPIVVLVISSVLCMLYVGGLFSGEGLSIMEAFGNTSAATAALWWFLYISIYIYLLHVPSRSYFQRIIRQHWSGYLHNDPGMYDPDIRMDNLQRMP